MQSFTYVGIDRDMEVHLFDDPLDVESNCGNEDLRIVRIDTAGNVEQMGWDGDLNPVWKKVKS